MVAHRSTNRAGCSGVESGLARGSGLKSTGFRVQGSGRRVQGSGLRVQGSGFAASGFRPGFECSSWYRIGKHPRLCDPIRCDGGQLK